MVRRLLWRHLAEPARLVVTTKARAIVRARQTEAPQTSPVVTVIRDYRRPAAGTTPAIVAPNN